MPDPESLSLGWDPPFPTCLLRQSVSISPLICNVNRPFLLPITGQNKVLLSLPNGNFPLFQRVSILGPSAPCYAVSLALINFRSAKPDLVLIWEAGEIRSWMWSWSIRWRWRRRSLTWGWKCWLFLIAKYSSMIYEWRWNDSSQGPFPPWND